MFKFPEAPSHASNYIKGVLDEICLEGLDGITPNDLWLRLNNRPYFPIKPKDEVSKSFLWEGVKRLESVSFYELPEPRPPLVLFDRFEHIDPELGVIIEPEKIPQNIYPHCKVEDPAVGIVGSCATYHTRKDITDVIRPLAYKDVVNTWGHKLVVVANQAARRRALQNPDVNPNLELTTMQYLVLERVGRSRYHGEITQGRDSLQTIGEDAKALFYLRKVLHKHRLITKQMFHQKLGLQNTCGLLLHLPRFFVERRPKALVLTEKVISHLKTKPNYMEEYSVLRQDPELALTLKKLSKTIHFQKFIKSDVVLYRTLYPDAPESDWKYKGANKEKSLRVLYLEDGSLDPKDVWQKYDDIYDDEDDDKCGLLDEGHRLLDRTMMAQAYSVLEKKGPEGVTQVELGSALGASKLAARMLVRNLSKSDKVTTYMQDEGRQRTARFALKKFDKCSDVKKQMIKEKDKHLKLVEMGGLSKAVKKLDSLTSKQNKSSKQVSKIKSASAKELSSLEVPSVQPTPMEVDKTVEEKDQSKNHTNPISCIETAKLKSLEKKKEISRQPEPSKPSKLEKDKEIRKDEKRGKKRKAKETPEIDQTKESEGKKSKSSHDKPNNTETVPEEIENASQEDSPEEEIKVEMSVPDLSLLSKKLGARYQNTAPSDLQKNTSMSFRILKRTNMIMETVQKQKVVFDTSKLQKMIYEEEMKEGYDVRMDKKSLLRIINKLTVEGHVKHVKMTLRGYGKEKTLTFICHPSVSTDHSVIQSALDQAKMKFQILGREAIKKKAKSKKKVPAPEPPGKTVDVHKEMVPPKVEENIDVKYNSRAGRIYGFKPKYMRMQVLHKYMFYLIYGYEGDESLDQEQAIADIENHIKVTDDVKAEMSQIYTASLDWRMFLPPLPVHSGYSEGWALMSDMLLRLPLSIFIQVVNVTYELPDIEEYVNHPIKKHFLVKNLPLNFKTTLTYARKYIFTVHEQVVRLCCTGLLQMGPQRLKEKDQVFVFLNRHAVLWDTTSSPVGYHQIAKDKDYPIHHYHFLSMADVEQYWYDLWNFCMHTMLGGRMCMDGQMVVVEGLQTKPEMLLALESRGVDEAPLRDTGYLPGDHLGAAGFDSAMFAHLKRNWYWNTTKSHTGYQSSSAPAPSTDLQPIKSLSKKEERKAPMKPARVISETSSARRRGGGRRGDRTTDSSKENQRRQGKRQLSTKRTVRMLQQRRRAGRKPYYDQVDREALLKMSKLRVDWTAKEDNLLLLCKVAFLIFQHIGKRYFNLITVRQILHEQFPEATDKTSRACQRRLNYMMKNSQTQRSVHLCFEEMKQDSVVMNKLKDLVEEMSREGKTRDSEAQLANSFQQLVLLLQERYKKLHSQDLSRLCEGFLLPDTVKELFENYRIIRPQKLKKRGFNAINNITDIHMGIINSTILSALNCVGDKTSWTYQLFSIYQQYSDKLLRTVMAKTRADQMVSLRKHYLRTHIRSGDYLPLSSSPYQLSISYINLLMTRYQSELYGDCLAMYQQLVTPQGEDSYEEVVAGKGGIAACIVELSSQDLIDFKLDIPEQIIVMDPNVIQKDETYTRIVKRYQDILTNCKDTDQVSVNTVFDESYTTQSQETEDAKPQHNTIAKAATRIALYLTREKEECDKSVEQNEMQHAHDFFVVNATRVFCRFLGKKFNEGDTVEKISPLPEEIVNRLLSKIKRLAVFPEKSAFDPDITTRIISELGESQEFVENLLEFIKDKKELGATMDDIRDTYGTDMNVARVLKSLKEAQVLLYCGVTQTHWVHQDYYRPWVVRSYKLLRLQKESIPNPGGRCLMLNVGEASETARENKSMKQTEEKLSIEADMQTENKEEEEEDLTNITAVKDEEPMLTTNNCSPFSLALPQSAPSISSCLSPENVSATDPIPSTSNCHSSTHSISSIKICSSPSQTIHSTNGHSSATPESIPSTSSCQSPSEHVPITSSCQSTSEPVSATSSCHSSSEPVPSTSSCISPSQHVPFTNNSPSDPVPSTSSCSLSCDPVPSTSNCPSPPLSPRRRRPPAQFDSLTSDIGTTDCQGKKSSAKFITALRKIKKAPPFDPKTKCNLNVCVRPWIRINGSLNRRVLDKFLTSVLGHIMILPLCSLKMVQERFTPAFQPHHTRELVEMLAELKCLRLLAVKHSHKSSLFSKPTNVSTVAATGLEDEEDIVIEPDPMAISNLSSFIKDTAYVRDIYYQD